MRLARALLPILVVLPVAASCRQVLGIDDRELALVDGGACGPLEQESPVCAQCLTDQCCDANAKCAADSACKSTSDCREACATGDSACLSACERKFPMTAARVARGSCLAGSCAAACGFRCEDIIEGAPACRACRAAKCCGAIASCAKNAACLSFSACLTACSPNDPVCPGRCANENPSGSSAHLATNECFYASCRDVCGNWGCAKKTPPQSTEAELTVGVKLADDLTRKPLVGITVRGCAESTCTPPFGEGTSDAEGRVALKVKPAAATKSYRGYFELVSAEYPTLIYFHPPVVIAPFELGVDLVSAANASAIAAASGVALDPARGFIIVRVRDCDGGAGAGASIVAATVLGEPIALPARTFYLDGASPTFDQQKTGASGVGGMINVAPGAVRIAAKVDGVEVGSTRVLVRAGHLTFTDLSAGYD